MIDARERWSLAIAVLLPMMLLSLWQADSAFGDGDARATRHKAHVSVETRARWPGGHKEHCGRIRQSMTDATAELTCDSVAPPNNLGHAYAIAIPGRPGYTKTVETKVGNGRAGSDYPAFAQDGGPVGGRSTVQSDDVSAIAQLATVQTIVGDSLVVSLDGFIARSLVADQVSVDFACYVDDSAQGEEADGPPTNVIKGGSVALPSGSTSIITTGIFLADDTSLVIAQGSGAVISGTVTCPVPPGIDLDNVGVYVMGDAAGVDDSVGGQVELPNGGDAPSIASDASGASFPYSPIAGGLAAAILALGAGGWYARRRWLRREG